jgi:DNA-binding transcriptional MocR family regulator
VCPGRPAAHDLCEWLCQNPGAELAQWAFWPRRRTWWSALLDTKLLATLTTPALLEKALALCIEQGQLRRHAERIRTRLDAARSALRQAGACRRAAPLPPSRPGCLGGSIRAWTPMQLAQRMLDEGYLLAPGALFHAERKPSTLMRINFATAQDATFWKTYSAVLGKMA